MFKINNIGDLIKVTTALAHKNQLQTALHLLFTIQLKGINEQVLDRAIDTIEYNPSETGGFINTKLLSKSPHAKDHYVRDLGDGVTRSVRKTDVFKIIRAIKSEALTDIVEAE